MPVSASGSFLPAWLAQLCLSAQLEKGAGHKYVRKVPTGNPKQPWRYYYNLTGGTGRFGDHNIVEGAKFKVGDGHLRVKAVKGRHVELEHDETGETHRMHRDHLADLLHGHHAEEVNRTLRRQETRAVKLDARQREKRSKLPGGRNEARRNAAIVREIEDAIGHDFGSVDFADERVQDTFQHYLGRAELKRLLSEKDSGAAFRMAIGSLISAAGRREKLRTWRDLLDAKVGDRGHAGTTTVFEVLREIGEQIDDPALARAQAPQYAIDHIVREDEEAHWRETMDEEGDGDAKDTGGDDSWDYDIAKGLAPVPRVLGILLMKHLLEKGAGHKYLRRVPTGNPKRPYRYFYKVTGGKGLAHDDEIKPGAAFAIKDAGKLGHIHVLAVEGDRVHFRHDESGVSANLHRAVLRDLLHQEHAEKLGAAKPKNKTRTTAAGTKKTKGQVRAVVPVAASSSKKSPHAAADVGKLVLGGAKDAGQQMVDVKPVAETTPAAVEPPYVAREWPEHVERANRAEKLFHGDEARVVDAFKGRRDSRVNISDLRSDSGLSRVNFDKAFRGLLDKLVVAAFHGDNPRELTQAHHDGGFDMSGVRQHYAYLDTREMSRHLDAMQQQQTAKAASEAKPEKPPKRAAPKKATTSKPGKTPAPRGVAVAEKDIAAELRKMVTKEAVDQGKQFSISELRSRVMATRQSFDAAMNELDRKHVITMFHEDDPQARTPADDRDAVKVSGAKQHRFWIVHPEKLGPAPASSDKPASKLKVDSGPRFPVRTLDPATGDEVTGQHTVGEVVTMMRDKLAAGGPALIGMTQLTEDLTEAFMNLSRDQRAKVSAGVEPLAIPPHFEGDPLKQGMVDRIKNVNRYLKKSFATENSMRDLKKCMGLKSDPGRVPDITNIPYWTQVYAGGPLYARALKTAEDHMRKIAALNAERRKLTADPGSYRDPKVVGRLAELDLEQSAVFRAYETAQEALSIDQVALHRKQAEGAAVTGAQLEKSGGEGARGGNDDMSKSLKDGEQPSAAVTWFTVNQMNVVTSSAAQAEAIAAQSMRATGDADIARRTIRDSRLPRTRPVGSFAVFDA